MMKQITFTALFISFSVIATAQTTKQNVIKKEPKHEISFDAFELVTSNTIKISYNFLLNNSESIGLNAAWMPDGSKLWDDDNYFSRFAFALNYKHYFSNKYAQGFYFEAFLQYKYGEAYDNKFTLNNPGDFARNHTLNLGFGIGYKLISKRNIFFDINAGIGKKIFKLNTIDPYQDNRDVTPYIGLKFGKRF